MGERYEKCLCDGRDMKNVYVMRERYEKCLCDGREEW